MAYNKPDPCRKCGRPCYSAINLCRRCQKNRGRVTNWRRYRNGKK